MFIVSNADLPSTASTSSLGGVIARSSIAEPNNYAPLTTIASQAIERIVITLPPYTGTTVEIDVSDRDLNAVEVIEIAGVKYSQITNPASIAPGEFYWNPISKAITVNFAITPTNLSRPGITIPPAGVSIVIYGRSGTPTDYVAAPYPNIFSLLPLEGSFKWGLTWEGQPSGSFEFRTLAQYKRAVISTLSPGTEFTAFGVGFRCANISITEVPATTEPTRMIQVSVSLGGRHENYLSRIVTLLPLFTRSFDDNLECLGRITETTFVDAEYPNSTTVQALASRSGDRFAGPVMEVDIPRGTPKNEGTTFIAKAQERVRQYGCFLRYSEFDAVKAIALNAVPTWYFNETQIRSPVSSTVAGRRIQQVLSASFHPKPLGTILPADLMQAPSITPQAENQNIYPYVHTYEPRYSLSGRFETDREKYLDELAQGSSGNNTVSNWRRRERVVQEIPDGDERPDIPPANTGPLKDISNNFSASGVTKTYKLSRTIDGLPQSDYLQRWGFAFLGREMYQGKTLVGATNCWKMIEEKVTTYLYDENTGYQLGSDTVGWELARFEEESSALETVKLDTQREADIAKAKLYEYFKLPYRRQERNALEALRDYYKDIGFPPVDIVKVCLPNGGFEYRAKFDPTYVEPFFTRIAATHENSFKAVPDPESTVQKPLQPKTTGKEAFFRQKLTILASKSTTTDAEASFSSFQDDRAEDSYNEYNSQFSSGDAGFANSAENTTFQRKSDRPSVATKLPSTFERVEPEDREGNGNKRLPIRYNYFVETNIDPFYGGGIRNNTVAQLSGGSLNYGAAKTLSQAQKAAETEITISNIKDCLQESFTIPFSPHIKDGDKLTYTCNATVRQRRVLNISHEVQIKGSINGVPIVVSSGSQVSCGLERKPPISFIREIEPKFSNQFDRYNFKLFFISDTAPMGEILDPGLQTRRNFSI